MTSIRMRPLLAAPRFMPVICSAQDDASRPLARLRITDLEPTGAAVTSQQAMTDDMLSRWRLAVSADAGFAAFARVLGPNSAESLPVDQRQIRPLDMLANCRTQVMQSADDSPSAGAAAPEPYGIADEDDGYQVVGDNASAEGFAGDDAAGGYEDSPSSVHDDIAGGFDSTRFPNATSEKEFRSEDSYQSRRHLVSSAFGLGLGYYILVWLRPELNFLHLDLPLLPPAAQSGAAPGKPPAAEQKP